MWIKTKYMLFSILTVVVCLASFLLPPRLLQAQDSAIVGEMKEYSIETTREDFAFSLYDSIDLLGGTEGSVLPLSNGRKHSMISINEALIQQFEQLNTLGLGLPQLNRDDLSSDPEKQSVLLWVSTQDPRRTAIFWQLYIDTPELKGMIIMEDDSGKIVNFELHYRTDNIFANLTSEKFIEIWSEYLKMEFISSNERDKAVSVYTTDQERNNETDIEEKELIFQQNNYTFSFDFFKNDNSIRCSLE